MTDAEIIYRAMILMARANAKADAKVSKDNRTQRIQWRGVRIDYYPASNTHGWFGRDTLSTKAKVLAAITECL